VRSAIRDFPRRNRVRGNPPAPPGPAPPVGGLWGSRGRRWKVEGGEGEGWKQPRQVGVDSKKVDGGGSEDDDEDYDDDDDDDDDDGEKRKTGRASNQENHPHKYSR